MIAVFQIQEIAIAALETDVAYQIVQDVELVHVGGGCTATHF